MKKEFEQITKRMLQIPTLSFCITCKNRIHQIKETLPKNLADNALYESIVEFVLVDFGSSDGLKEWVLSNFDKELNSGYLKYYYTNELPYWHASIAKNTSHVLASNEILLNLDCDNYTGYNGGKYVIKNFMKYGSEMVSQQFSGDYDDGTYGRIGITKHFFSKIGGYDESLEYSGFEDVDLILRAANIGLVYRDLYKEQYSTAISNSIMDKVRNCNTDLSYYQMNAINMKKSAQNRLAGKFIANNGTFGIRKGVFNYQGKEIIV